MFYKVIGLMSGTSLDGLDIAYCEFEEQNGRWSYRIIESETVPYTDDFRKRVIAIENASAVEFSSFDVELGHYFGRLTRKFIDKHSLTPDFVCSHGQTIFHQPAKGYTTQIGNLAALCSEVRMKTIGDFRTLDVMLGGQGAPLVPIGDLLLFADYDNCLNIGGFSNISRKKEGKITAFDICPVNIVLNHLCGKIGLPFDKDGEIAANSAVDNTLVEKLNALPYYESKKTGKSLGKEWVLSNVFPLLESSGLSIESQIASYTLHAAEQISKNILSGKTLISGGGAYNTHLLNLIRQNSQSEIEIADKTTTDYKEAMIFAFLGVLREREQVNCLASVTGASQNTCGGSVVQWIQSK